MLKRVLNEPWAVAALIAVLAAGTVGAALMLQASGYAPCELCLKERLPYYVGVPVAVATALAARAGLRLAMLSGFVVLIVCFMAGTALGLYHGGVEMKLWAGPTECSGAVTAAPDVADFLKQLQSVSVVRCDEAALHVFGLSLALWNALICLVFIGLANMGLLRAGGETRLERS